MPIVAVVEDKDGLRLIHELGRERTRAMVRELHSPKAGCGYCLLRRPAVHAERAAGGQDGLARETVLGQLLRKWTPANMPMAYEENRRGRLERGMRLPA